ncbi:MAG: hypothetical protein WDW36_001282 [Sanguina aurantia]
MGLEAAVPREQRPSNELQQLKTDGLYSWGSLEIPEYVQRLAAVFTGFFVVISGPIAFQTFDPAEQPAEFALASTVGALFVVAILTLRLFLGWQYVGDRLMSATVPYEESGWYDGEIFVKPPEVLTRDRLLGIYECKPSLARLKNTMLGSGVALLLCSVVLVGLIRTDTDGDGMYGRGAARVPRMTTATGIVFSSRVTDINQLAYDDDLAAAEAEAAGGVPGYCSDRYYQAAAGGQYCGKFQ